MTKIEKAMKWCAAHPEAKAADAVKAGIAEATYYGAKKILRDGVPYKNWGKHAGKRSKGTRRNGAVKRKDAPPARPAPVASIPVPDLERIVETLADNGIMEMHYLNGKLRVLIGEWHAWEVK